MADHTFLLRPGLWRAEGEFVDALGARTGVEGRAEIRHDPSRWIFESALHTRAPQPRESRSVYEVHPLAPGNLSTPWASQSASFGALNGRFLFLPDVILSTWESATGRFRGSETLVLRDPRHYSARGALWEGQKLLSAWMVELHAA